MYAPRVFASIIGVLIVFAVSTYALTGSIGTTFWQTGISAVLLQVGYFAGVLIMVARAERSKRNGASKSEAVKSEQDPGKTGSMPVSRLNTPESPNV